MDKEVETKDCPIRKLGFSVAVPVDFSLTNGKTEGFLRFAEFNVLLCKCLYSLASKTKFAGETVIKREEVYWSTLFLDYLERVKLLLYIICNSCKIYRNYFYVHACC